MTDSRSLTELGRIIQSRSTTIAAWLGAAEIPQPSLSATYPWQEIDYPRDIEQDRAEILEALDELRTLLLGPTSYLFHTSITSVSYRALGRRLRMTHGHHELTDRVQPVWVAVFTTLYRFQIAQNVPRQGSISYTDLAAQCDLGELDLRRVIRAAVSIRIFEEGDGHVRHNAISAALASPLSHDAVGFFAEEFHPAAMKFSEALRQFPGSKMAGESALALVNGLSGDMDIFSHVSKDPVRFERFANAMSWMAMMPGTASSHFVNNVPWGRGEGQAVPACPRTIVDIGGSHGDLCKALLRGYPGIERAIVQDLPRVTQISLEETFEAEYSNRIEYQAYDFFTEQPVKEADVYIFRTVLHDWPDSYAIKILRNQVPAMKPGARILINDICLESGQHTDPLTQQAQCTHDMMVKMGVNAQERTTQEWANLLSEANRGYKINSIVSPQSSVHSIIEVVWEENP
ncbi:hypothetical protein PG997_014612 [Apiospora hydei]|uniref:O-methyltransferase C-terminal domain-containing protein n=1 Tax=Apiospora hydei TaxID=1337664 RepID=A0ABR1UUA9_9PEZI